MQGKPTFRRHQKTARESCQNGHPKTEHTDNEAQTLRLESMHQQARRGSLWCAPFRPRLQGQPITQRARCALGNRATRQGVSLHGYLGLCITSNLADLAAINTRQRKRTARATTTTTDLHAYATAKLVGPAAGQHHMGNVAWAFKKRKEMPCQTRGYGDSTHALRQGNA